ncbi:helicase-related protein [Ahrensia marina]|uniref:helicase-related protein n=1 Tax=Ahrensia marina TaxID=1514904 RepID=UPI0035CEEC32
MPYTARSKAPGAGVTAILGPTNTGKTYMAIERMMTHQTGLIGLPLRLLAREVYLKLCARAGEDKVALVTGEEKIIPMEPRYWVSTVEAMPRDLDVDFVAVDEVQMAANLERGHVFTDRILNVRGKLETMLLGAGTIRGLLASLLPGVTIIQRPRMSLITYAGSKKITRQPRRTAVVAFSANDVYSIAELIRRQRGGAAVVLGALSPRTRNAQVDIYQNGDVDFLVATDAIGMGLNLDVDHVAFAGRHKFDGFDYRELTAAEMGQISGRAGRHTRDGTFGVTGRTEPLDDYLVEKLETHAFEPVKRLQWRNADLDFASIEALRDSLDDIPGHDLLTRALPQEDADTLDGVLRDKALRERATSRERVEMLWDACQLPDYRKIAPAQHIEIVGQLFAHIADRGTVPDDWMDAQLKNSDRVDGDIDALSARIAQVRTWTFVANRNAWLDDPTHWQERTRALEDALSDALHEKLTQRFVDRRTSVLMRRLREKVMLEAMIASDGDVQVEGQHVGWLAGFRFTPDTTAEDLDGKAVRTAAQKALAAEIQRRAEKLSLADDAAFVLDGEGAIRWTGEVVAKLSASDDILKPKIILLADEQLTGGAREIVDTRLSKWLTDQIEKHLGSLLALREGDGLEGIARGIGFRLAEELGAIDRREIAGDVKALEQEARATLRKHGVRFGAYALFVPQLLKPAPAGLLATLWALQNGGMDQPGLRELPQLNASGRTSIPVDESFDKRLYPIAGFRVCGRRAVRFDILERLADLIRPLVSFRVGQTEGEAPEGAAEGAGFTVTVEMTSLLGCAGDDFSEVLKSLGYKMERKTVPIEPAAPEAVVAKATEAETETKADTATPTEPTAEASATEPAADEPIAAEVETTDAAPSLETPEPTTPSEAPPSDSADDATPSQASASEATDASQPSVSEASASEQSTAEDEEQPTEHIVEIWRPAPNRPRHQGRPGGRRQGAGHGEGQEAGNGQQRGPRQRADKGKRPDRGDRRGKGPRRDGKGGKPSGPRTYSAAPPKKERQADPDSPFAALAGLLDNKDGDS